MGVDLPPPSREPEATVSEAWAARNPGSFEPQRVAPDLSDAELEIVNKFHDLYYSKLDEGRGLHTVVLSWMGYEMFKCPLDLWIYQEIIFSRKPEAIIETGTYKGGSSLSLATLCDQVGQGLVVSVDIDPTHAAIRPKHPRIRYVEGSSIDPGVFADIQRQIGDAREVLVILDSDHRKDHVLAELRAFCGLVPVGGYIVVEDTNVNGHPTLPGFGPGPMEAVEAFLAENESFRSDVTRERFLLTMNPRGYLQRVSGLASDGPG